MGAPLLPLMLLLSLLTTLMKSFLLRSGCRPSIYTWRSTYWNQPICRWRFKCSSTPKLSGVWLMRGVTGGPTMRLFVPSVTSGVGLGGPSTGRCGWQHRSLSGDRLLFPPFRARVGSGPWKGVPVLPLIEGKCAKKPPVALCTNAPYVGAAVTGLSAASKHRDDAPSLLTHPHKAPLVVLSSPVNRPFPKVDHQPPLADRQLPVAPPLLPPAPRFGSGNDLPTPVSPSVLHDMLVGYDCDLHHYLVHGFSHGFCIGCFGLPPQPEVHKGNLQSAEEYSGVIDAKIAKELASGRVLGPFDVSPSMPNYRVSPLGVVPKKTPGEFRMIHHLSHPEGSSVNDFIPKDMSSVHYATIQDAIDFIKDSP